jgi:pimeloyl-ACP methyl ester carboxylesterase
MARIHQTLLWAVMMMAALASLVLAQGATPRQVEVFGQKIHYLEAGSGPPVILLHGLGGDTSNWALTVPALAARFHVYVPDQIGFGQSDKPLINYRVATLVEFLNGFYQKLGITRATVVGNSLGGWTAMAFALAHPEKVERLVLVDAAGYSPERTNSPKLTREVMLQLNPATTAGLKQLMSNYIFYNQQMVTDQMIEQLFAAKLRRNDGYTVNQFIESILRGEDYLDGKLGAVKAPTLVIWGREDKLTPLAMGEAFARDIPGAESVILDRCGHVPQLECAMGFNAALLKFLAGAPAAQSRAK